MTIAGFGTVHMPFALARKYPNRSNEFAWQCLFPSERRSLEPLSKVERGHQFGEITLQRALKGAVLHSGIHKLSS